MCNATKDNRAVSVIRDDSEKVTVVKLYQTPNLSDVMSLISVTAAKALSNT